MSLPITEFLTKPEVCGGTDRLLWLCRIRAVDLACPTVSLRTRGALRDLKPKFFGANDIPADVGAGCHAPGPALPSHSNRGNLG